MESLQNAFGGTRRATGHVSYVCQVCSSIPTQQHGRVVTLITRWTNLLVRCVRTILQPEHLRRTGMITLVVGTWLTAFNQGDVLWETALNQRLALKIFLNYLTPFVVSNAGLLSFEENEND